MDKEITHYSSPVRLVLHAAEPLQPFSAQTLTRARKKLLAELALSNEELTLDAVTYTRNDVTNLLQDMTEEQWSNHCLIYSNEKLLSFLEKSSFDAQSLSSVRPNRYKPGFVSFVSPYFAWSFLEVSGRLIREVNPTLLADLLGYHDFMEPEHLEAAEERLRVYFDELLYLLRNMSWEKYSERNTVLNFLYATSWIDFVNALPDTLAASRDSVVEQLLALVFRFQHKASWSHLDQICQRILLIRCSPEQRAEAEEYAGIMRRNSGHTAAPQRQPQTPQPQSGREENAGRYTEPPRQRRTSNGRIWFSVIWVIILIVRGASRCNSDRYSSGNLSVDDYAVSPVSESTPVYTSPADQLTSIDNEQHLKAKLTQLSSTPHPGKEITMKTGQTPFPGISILPDGDFPDSMKIVNRTNQDMVLYHFGPHHPLLDSSSRMYAVFIRKGDTYNMLFEPNKGYFCASFGTGWVRLSKPVQVDLKHKSAGRVTRDEISPNNESASGDWKIRGFFKKPLKERFLQREVLFKDHMEYVNSSLAKPIYETDADSIGNNRGELHFINEGSRIELRGTGSYYIYLSAERP